MKNIKENHDDSELIKSKRRLKVLRMLMIVIDVLALIILVFQIIIKDIAYYSYIILIFCNIITFMAKPYKK